MTTPAKTTTQTPEITSESKASHSQAPAGMGSQANLSAPPVRISLMKEISEQIRRPFLIGMAILLMAGLGSYFALESYRSSSRRVASSDRVISELNDLLSNIDRAEAAERGYLTSGSSGKDETAGLAVSINHDLEQLQQAARDGTVAAAAAMALSTKVETKLKFFEQLSAVRAKQGEAAATAMFTAGQSNDLQSAIHDRAQQMISAQDRLLASHLANQHLLSHLLGFLVVSGCILAFAAVTYAGYFVENAFKLITSQLGDDASGREALAALNQTLEERIDQRTAEAAKWSFELERARKDLNHQGQVLQAVLNFINEGVMVCDTHMRLLESNAAAKRLFGDDLGRQSLDHLPQAFELIGVAAERPAEVAEWPLARAVRGDQCELDFQLRHRESGAAHLVESTSIPLRDDNGAVRAALAIFRDLTPAVMSQRSTALLEALSERIDDALIKLAHDGRVLSWNPAAVRMFGYAPEEIIGHACRRIVSQEAIGLTREVTRRMLAGGGCERFELEAVRKDGSHVPVMAEAFPISKSVGEDASFMLICRNLSEQKLLRAEAASARAMVLESARSRFEFLINMSHDFQTSLNRITGVLPLLLESTLSAQQRDYVQAISSSSKWLLQAVNDILDLAGLASGKVEFNQGEFDLYETVEEAVDTAAEQGQSKDIELILTIGPDLPRHLVGDRRRIAQILATLAESSLKFNDHGEVVVSVDCEERGESFTAVRFEVRGTGTALPPDLQARLFQPFMASVGRTARDLGGTGLGLAIAAQLVERLGGGPITVGGEPGLGSVLRFTLRFANVAEDGGRREQWPELAPRRILVVDDSASSRVSICGQLAQWGLAPDSAIGGAEALLAIRERAAAGAPYDLVLADMRMPGMDGFALYRAIKSDPRVGHTQLVMMGPYGVPEQPDTDGWLVKPIKPTRLFDYLTQAGPCPATEAREDTTTSEHASSHSQAPGTKVNGSAAEVRTQPSCASLDRSVLEALRSLSGASGSDLISVMTGAFTSDLPMRITQLETAMAANDMTTLKTRAAALRGLAAGLGLTRMAALCADLAAHAEHNERQPAAVSLSMLRDEAGVVLPLLEREAGMTVTQGEGPQRESALVYHIGGAARRQYRAVAIASPPAAKLIGSKCPPG